MTQSPYMTATLTHDVPPTSDHTAGDVLAAAAAQFARSFRTFVPSSHVALVSTFDLRVELSDLADPRDAVLRLVGEVDQHGYETAMRIVDGVVSGGIDPADLDEIGIAVVRFA